MKIGFTGTREGMTTNQALRVGNLLTAARTARDAVEFHHGDCVGSDDDADSLARFRGFKIYIHPGPLEFLRAHCERRGVSVVYGPKPFLERNQDIVDVADALIATPSEFVEQRNSGTWSTVRRARKKGVLIYLVRPDGSVVKEGAKP